MANATNTVTPSSSNALDIATRIANGLSASKTRGWARSWQSGRDSAADHPAARIYIKDKTERKSDGGYLALAISDAGDVSLDGSSAKDAGYWLPLAQAVLAEVLPVFEEKVSKLVPGFVSEETAARESKAYATRKAREAFAACFETEGDRAAFESQALAQAGADAPTIVRLVKDGDFEPDVEYWTWLTAKARAAKGIGQ